MAILGAAARARRGRLPALRQRLQAVRVRRRLRDRDREPAQAPRRAARCSSRASSASRPHLSPERLTTDRPVRRGEAAYRAHHFRRPALHPAQCRWHQQQSTAGTTGRSSMTETVNGRRDGKPAAKAQPAAPALTIERVFSTEGVHPYDEITWERRDVVQTNWKTGETVFEQRGVEFPDFWSVNASTIVTTKYFRGAVGTDVREWSLKQLIDRVVKTYRKGGEDHGYFATAGRRRAVRARADLAAGPPVLLVQRPVWFNVGTQSPQQVSACFILSVDDSMDSILNWYKEEGFIFKGGSGAGLNLSRIRSSKELLSSRRHGVRPGLLHARRRRVRRHHQVRRRHPPRGQDGRARRRPPRHRGVRDDQGARGGQDPRAARRRLRHGPRRPRHHLGPIPERQQLGPRHRRVHARGRGRHRVRAARPQDRRGHRDRRRPRAVPQDQHRPRGSAPTRVSSTTTRSTTGTPTPRPAGSPRPTRAPNTCRSTTPRATSRRSTC